MEDDEEPNLPRPVLDLGTLSERGEGVDSWGRKWRVRAGPFRGFSVRNDGVVEHFSEDENGNREEWTEPLCDSPVREVFPGWVWDELDDSLDPRQS